METSPPKVIGFGKSGPFLGLMETYSAAVCGIQSMADPRNPMAFRPRQIAVITGRVWRFTSPIYEVHRRLVKGGDPAAARLFEFLTCMLVNAAYEAVKDHADQSPLFEFFRHIRSAASHGNKFYFKSKEPSRPACWRGVTIDHTLKGRLNPLSGKPCFHSDSPIHLGDVALLLWDVEQILLAVP